MRNSSMTVKVKRSKIPTYIAAYEDLYEKIMSGALEEQLPTEAALAEQYGISRGSMRQALAILRDDGLIYNVQGSGNYVNKNSVCFAGSFEKLGNPVFDCTSEKIDEVSIFCTYEPMTAIVRKKLDIATNEIALKCNTVYLHQGVPVAHVYYEIPSKALQIDGLNLYDEDDIRQLITVQLYEMASMSSARVMPSIAEEDVGKYLKVEDAAEVLFIEEVLYGEKSEAFALCKYYLLPQYYQLNITRR